MAEKKSRAAYMRQYRKEHCRQVIFYLDRVKDADIIERFNEIKDKVGTFREASRQYFNRQDGYKRAAEKRAEKEQIEHEEYLKKREQLGEESKHINFFDESFGE